MSYEAAVSPFGTLTEEECWSLWKKTTTVLSLEDAEQTDGRYVIPVTDYPYHAASTDQAPPYVGPPAIDRRQYNSILSRFDQASKRAGCFSTWNT